MEAAPDGAGSETAAAREEALGAFSHQLAEALGRPADLPRETAERAAVDPLYLHTLIARRDAPDAVSGLIAQSSGTSLPKWAPRPTHVLVAKAARALSRIAQGNSA
ncbi:hypothetical protein ABZT49_18550 [Methylobacterium sp. EM32]|uniref:hypothetical protein n=1 Tax=Methylobacterium sp. EM32 TaxID=3163481 RepID=UPI0033B054D5